MAMLKACTERPTPSASGEVMNSENSRKCKKQVPTLMYSWQRAISDCCEEQRSLTSKCGFKLKVNDSLSSSKMCAEGIPCKRRTMAWTNFCYDMARVDPGTLIAARVAYLQHAINEACFRGVITPGSLSSMFHKCTESCSSSHMRVMPLSFSTQCSSMLSSTYGSNCQTVLGEWLFC